VWWKWAETSWINLKLFRVYLRYEYVYFDF
jgi:hypothetical protein